MMVIEGVSRYSPATILHHIEDDCDANDGDVNVDMILMMRRRRMMMMMIMMMMMMMMMVTM